MIAQVDDNGDGCIDFQEFRKMMILRFEQEEKQKAERKLRKVFKVYSSIKLAGLEMKPPFDRLVSAYVDVSISWKAISIAGLWKAINIL